MDCNHINSSITRVERNLVNELRTNAIMRLSDLDEAVTSCELIDMAEYASEMDIDDSEIYILNQIANSIVKYNKRFY